MKPLAVCLILAALIFSAYSSSRSALADDASSMLRWIVWTVTALLAAMVFPLFV